MAWRSGLHGRLASLPVSEGLACRNTIRQASWTLPSLYQPEQPARDAPDFTGVSSSLSSAACRVASVTSGVARGREEGCERSGVGAGELRSSGSGVLSTIRREAGARGVAKGRACGASSSLSSAWRSRSCFTSCMLSARLAICKRERSRNAGDTEARFLCKGKDQTYSASSQHLIDAPLSSYLPNAISTGLTTPWRARQA
jgi:hypothetical protein